MIPTFLYESIAVVCLRVALELALPYKHASTPGRITGFVHGAACAYWAFHQDWLSAIAATFLYLVSDTVLNAASPKPRDFSMLLHHILGAALCFYAIDHGFWRGNTPEADLTNSLVFMETTNLSVQVAFIAFYEFEYTYFMTPAFLHFLVVRVGCLGHYILTHFTYFWLNKSLFLKGLYGIVSLLWIQQIFWSLLWLRRLLAELFKSEKEKQP
jgi:hypothetical protein